MIDGTELIGVVMSSDGKRLKLRIRDQNGQTVAVSVPSCWLNTMLAALPQSSSAENIHPLDSWSMDRVSNGQDLVLTLRTPEGQAVSFAMKPWQVKGMATIANYGRTFNTTIH